MVGNRKGHPFYCVADDGIGIPKSEQGRIFERFYRVDKSHSRQTGGTGLGLSIVKHGATLHHAQINVESEQELEPGWRSFSRRILLTENKLKIISRISR